MRFGKTTSEIKIFKPSPYNGPITQIVIESGDYVSIHSIDQGTIQHMYIATEANHSKINIYNYH